MKFLETKHERDSAKITSLLILVILLLLFVVGMPYMDPPEEFGVAVNFGTSDVGSGAIQPLNPAPQATPQPKTESEVKPTETKKVSEEVLTNDSQESIAINKQKEEALKKQQEAERIAREKQEQEIKKQQEEAEKKRKLDALIGGVTDSEGKDTGGEGNDNVAGDKGQLDGNPYASSYFGGSGPGKGGVGFGLSGRGVPTRKIFKQECNEYGLVIVRIEVNPSGEVIKAEPGVQGTTNTHPCLLEPAKRIALSHKWPADSNAPARQIGFVSINFSIGQ
ncbi:energy transducer TonB [Paucihalobacter ruber]|uniref:Energy transducer TonB n=1 Tax=Paucihalobacter ruber TaxID=2567861 RepID=A0A506PKQ5_9FLAO|nr:energy transducer TonB [Paucihalobacter ruber]TPV34229.1 energy transducer TonB [Paucihalobacter ruber]